MSTPRADLEGGARLRRTAVALSALVALAVAMLSACGDDESPVTPDTTDRDAAAAIQKTLRQRARAIVERDPVLFDATVAQRDPDFVAEQDRYLDNLGQLPLGVVRFSLVEDSLEADGRAYWAEVVVRIELQGYDVAPVVTRDRWRFAPVRDGRRYLLTSTRDEAWEDDDDTRPQPWDLGPIEVRTAPGVLGIFDTSTVWAAETVLAIVGEGRFEVRSVLPDHLEDPGGVVVYTLADPDIDDEPDAVTVPVPRDARRPDGPTASYRVVLSPGVLDEEEQVVERLVRHELTHVALGEDARRAPVWLSEGLAEYVSVRPLAPGERRLQTDALNLVAGGIDDLPPAEAFSGPDAEGWYAVAWWVCEYVAATYGESTLWSLVDAFAAGGDEQSVLLDQLGLTSSQLAEAGVALMRTTYG